MDQSKPKIPTDVVFPQLEQIVLLRAVEQNPASIAITDPAGAIIYVNPRFCEVTGYSVAEVLGQNPRVLKGNDGFTDYGDMWRTLTSGQQWRGEFHNRRKNGEFFWELASISPILDAEGEISHFLAIKEDITERKQVEEELQRTVAEATQMAVTLEFQNGEIEEQRRELDRAYTELKNTQVQMLQREKMASIGQLAAGMAHEINNPIGFVTSNLRSMGKYFERMANYIDHLEKTVEAEAAETWQNLQPERKKVKLDYLLEDSRDLIEESLDGAERVKTIVQNLKSFSHLDQAEEQDVDLNECFESTVNIVWNEIKYKATLEKDLGQLPKFRGNPQELNQVFMNLLVNAGQAIETEGTIKVRTWQEDSVILASVSDTGCGIPEENLGRIFEPFFTTKEVGEGTGLGMSISYEIIKKHGGGLDIDSTPGQGTTFTIRLPLENNNNPVVEE